jgi:hypothetical protein
VNNKGEYMRVDKKENEAECDKRARVLRIFALTLLYLLAVFQFQQIKEGNDKSYLNEDYTQYFKMREDKRRITESFNHSFNIERNSLNDFNKKIQVDFQDNSINVFNIKDTGYFLQRQIQNESLCEYINLVEFQNNRKPIFIEMIFYGGALINQAYTLIQLKNGDYSVIHDVLSEKKDLKTIPDYDLFLINQDQYNNFCYENKGKYVQVSKL